MSIDAEELDKKEEETPKSFFNVIVHSFFIIPFLITVFCLILFSGIRLLTRENRTAYDYIKDVKIGGLTKRWQSAFELSKILSNPKLLPKDTTFYSDLSLSFQQAKYDDDRIRQYLALAMGRTKKKEFVKPLLEALKEESNHEENLVAIIYALGMLSDKSTATPLYDFMDHPNKRVRSMVTVALGNIGNRDAIKFLYKNLNDSEVNVQWGAALSLAHFSDGAGKNIILKMLTREYYNNFEQVDKEEVKNLMLSAITAATQLNDIDINKVIVTLAKEDPSMKIRVKAKEAMERNGR